MTSASCLSCVHAGKKNLLLVQRPGSVNKENKESSSSHTTLSQSISNRGCSPASHRTGGEGGVVVSVVACMSINLGHKASEGGVYVFGC